MARYRRISLFFSTILALSLAQTDPTPNYDVTEHGDSCLYSLLVDKPVGGCQETFSPRKRHTDLQNQLRDMDQAIDMAEERRSQALVEKKNNLLKEEAARLAVENEIAEMQFRTQDLEESNGKLGEKLQEQTAKMKELQDQIKNLNTAISQLIDEKKEAESDKGPSEPASSPTTTAATPELVPAGTQQPTAAARDCTLLKKDKTDEKSGVKTLVLPDGQEYKAFCDFSSPGGPWTVIQRRQKTDAGKQVDFFKTWDEYRTGFGNPDGEYWIECQLFMCYCRLKLGEYTGTAGDALYVHRDQPFSTKDREHDTLPTGNCASAYRGGWWYAKCFDANLNGDYSDDSEATLSSVSWVPWQGYRAIPYVEMKIRHKPAEPAASVP
ncbi:PREDICTED: techylectin-5A-like [Branchiostoma belcheri]|uniref:Techylectin-5A-like n=1 Tax=Branchiostoma belcheri TaxID=7741 RepID=A0A6P4XZY2_BRABE|nr:PREDICTED: techylectin-5A-like [Branchiostoma belcheri]